MFHTFETCAKHARNVRNALRESRKTCTKHVRKPSRIIANPRIISESCGIPRNIAKHARTMREKCVMPCVNLAKHFVKHARNMCETSRPPRHIPAVHRYGRAGSIAPPRLTFRYYLVVEHIGHHEHDRDMHAGCTWIHGRFTRRLTYCSNKYMHGPSSYMSYTAVRGRMVVNIPRRGPPEGLA
jgi:hypothetical protein